MRTRTTYIATLVGAAAAAAAIAVAPTAAAAPGPSQPNCTANGVGSVCQSPGNVQITRAPTGFVLPLRRRGISALSR